MLVADQMSNVLDKLYIAIRREAASSLQPSIIIERVVNHLANEMNPILLKPYAERMLREVRAEYLRERIRHEQQVVRI